MPLDMASGEDFPPDFNPLLWFWLYVALVPKPFATLDPFVPCSFPPVVDPSPPSSPENDELVKLLTSGEGGALR